MSESVPVPNSPAETGLRSLILIQCQNVAKERTMRLRNGLWACLAILILGNLTGLLAIGPAAHAQSVQSSPVSAEVTEALARMNKTLQAEKFSFRANTTRAYAGPNGELLHIGHKLEIAVHRPDRLLVNAMGDDGSSKMFYDGKNLTVYGVD